MTYDYGARSAWLDDLAAAPSPAGYDLCAAHADGLGVPQGWIRTDRRVDAAAARRSPLDPAAPVGDREVEAGLSELWAS